ncbi:MAG: nitrite reductase/ring-hydroxylating ferredoxin subunit [Hyphomicrobiaceae bacterium]|jgi:nitrite reductase/ring-hydroxylating ferredoxin subunit
MEDLEVYGKIPTGWYVVATSEELGAGDVLRRHYFGRELVLWRTEGGEPALVDAYCPHMGAHFGHGGRVDGDNLRCPFHGFSFGASGQCTGIPYEGDPVPDLRVPAMVVQEHSGLILAWYDAKGRSPEWSVPELPTDGWTGMALDSFHVHSHPQETSENSVDFGHFRFVHGFDAPHIRTEVALDGPLLTAGYGFRRSLDPDGDENLIVDVEIDIEVHGLGYSLVNIHVPSYELRFRQFVLPTPIDGEHIELRLATAIPKQDDPEATKWLLGTTFDTLKAEVAEDIPIWENKRYVARPGLAASEKRIAVYRGWARQFYE